MSEARLVVNSAFLILLCGFEVKRGGLSTQPHLFIKRNKSFIHYSWS